MPEERAQISLSRQVGQFAWSSDCNCDCACPVLEANAWYAQKMGNGVDLRHGLVIAMPVGESHRLLYNLKKGGDVAVLNRAAYQVWQGFAAPRKAAGLGTEQREAAGLLAAAGLLEPAGTPAQVAPRSTILSVWLHVTNACNLECSYCHVHKSLEHMSLWTGLAAVDAAFRSALAGGFHTVLLKYSGGEPTLQLERLLQIHSYAEQKARETSLKLDGVLLSNGAALDRKKLEQIQAHGLRLTLSLDGMGALHDTQRPLAGGGGSFERGWKALQAALDLEMRPFISITVTEESAGGLADWVEQLLSLGLPFNLNLVRPPEGQAMPDNGILLSGLRAALQRIEANLPEYSLLGSLLDRGYLAQGHQRPCGAGESYLVIDHSGMVSRCHMALGERITDVWAEDPLGDVQIAEIGQNPAVDEKESCKECQWRYVCGGGCPLTARQAAGSYAAASPYCRIYRELYPEILRLEALRILKFQPSNL